VYLCCVEREKERKVVGIDEILCLCCEREREREMARARKRGCENSAGLMLIFFFSSL
jgi:hypothetical protein